MIKFILDLLFEERCIGCKKSGQYACVECILKAEPATEPNDMNIFSALAFHDPIVRKSIRKLKYHRSKLTAIPLSEALYDRACELIAEKRLIWGLGRNEKIILIPVPLSYKRFKKRGYNQAELIAQAFASQDQSMSFIVRNDVLYKTRETESQVSVKDKQKRLRNVLGAYEAKNCSSIVDKCIILFDDVTTTGATLVECMKVLKEAGAREVFALTVAH